MTVYLVIFVVVLVLPLPLLLVWGLASMLVSILRGRAIGSLASDSSAGREQHRDRGALPGEGLYLDDCPYDAFTPHQPTPS
jgi:hypothetical protein